LDFVAIDFETANKERSSACALGIAVVRNGQIIKKNHWLLKPPQNYFSPFNISIHGITEDTVKDKPDFKELWPTIRRYFENEVVVAHYAGFDIGVLQEVLNEYEIDYPQFSYSCSRIIAKKVWPNRINYGLKVVAEFLGIKFVHHDAEEDARACAQIVIEASKRAGADSINELAKRFEFKNGQMYPGGHRPLRYSFGKVEKIVPTTDQFDPKHTLFAKTVVFTGKLSSMVRREAVQRVVNVGGRCSNSVNGMVDFLVLGELDFAKLNGDRRSAKIKKVEHLIAQGIEVEVITENEFLEML